MSDAQEGELSAIGRDLLAPLVDGRAEQALTDGELMKIAERAQHQAGNLELAAELLAIAKKLHDANATIARDQTIIVAAVVLEDVELNGALCRRLYAGRRSMADVTGHPEVQRPSGAAPDAAHSALATRLAALAGVKKS
jgi:hypothetical protein